MKILIALLIIPSILFAQSLQYISEFGNFENASSFDIDLSNNFYVSDTKTNSISKIDSNGNLINSIGGYGWEPSTFDEPIEVVTNTLSLYVADKNNHRIQRFDKDLNFLSEYSGTNSNNEVMFGYPISINISDIGDLYILDSDNNKILKFNLIGEFLQEIGGNDAGVFAINNPKSLAIDNSNNIIVLDEEYIKVFDQYGNDLFYFKPNGIINKIKFSSGLLIFINENEIKLFDLNNRKMIGEFLDLQNLGSDKIVDAEIISNNLFILTQTQIFKYFLVK